MASPSDESDDGTDGGAPSSPAVPSWTSVDHTHAEYPALEYGLPFVSAFPETVGWWGRLGADIIDNVIAGVAAFGVAAVIIIVATGGAIGDNIVHDPVIWGALLVAFIVHMGYYTLQWNSSRAATLGIRAVGGRITRSDGSRMSLRRCFGRYFAKVILYLPQYTSTIFYIASAITIARAPLRQAVHDKMADTLVVREQIAASDVESHPVYGT